MKKLVKKEQSSAVSAYIGPDTVFEGAISSPGAVRIDGILKGNVTTGATVYIGVNGMVSGDVNAGRVLLCGRVEGRLNVEERVELAKSGSINGEVYTSNFIIEEGATLNGSCTMHPEPLKQLKADIA